MDKIYVTGMNFYGYHGVFPEENRLGQQFIVDVVMQLSLSAAGKEDAIEKTVNYGLVYESVKKVVEGKPKKLLEAVAEKIADTLLKDYPISSCTIKMIKPNPPINGQLQYVAVEITRGKNE